MKILFVSHDASRSGAPSALIQLLAKLKEQRPDIEATILCLRGGSLFNEFSKIYPTSCISECNRIFKKLLNKFKLSYSTEPWERCLKRVQYDLIYANTIAALDVSINIKKRQGGKLLLHVHECESIFHDFDIQKQALEHCDLFIAVSEIVKRNLVYNYGIQEDKITIQHPVSPHIIKIDDTPSDTDKINFGSEHVVGLSGYSHWVKGIDILPYIVSIFLRRYPQMDVEFVVVGHFDPKAKYHLDSECRRLGVADHVHFAGIVTNPLEYYKKFDLFLLTSREDSFPLAVEECGALGIPVIAFEGTTGANEWLSAQTGAIVPYMNFEETADAIYELLTDDKSKASKSSFIRKKAWELFVQDAQQRDIIKVLDNLEYEQA